PQAAGGIASSTPAIASASSSAAMTTTTGGKRRPGFAARNARSPSSRTAAVYGASALALLALTELRSSTLPGAQRRPAGQSRRRRGGRSARARGYGEVDDDDDRDFRRGARAAARRPGAAQTDCAGRASAAVAAAGPRLPGAGGAVAARAVPAHVRPVGVADLGSRHRAPRPRDDGRAVVEAAARPVHHAVRGDRDRRRTGP